MTKLVCTQSDIFLSYRKNKTDSTVFAGELPLSVLTIAWSMAIAICLALALFPFTMQTGDIVLITSLFVLGGDFWDKLRSMFIYGAKASFPDKNKNE